MANGITRLALGYAIKFTFINVQLDYSFQSSVQSFYLFIESNSIACTDVNDSDLPLITSRSGVGCL